MRSRPRTCSFWLDVEDANPLLVFQSHVNGGIWFKTTIPEEEKGQNHINPEDWVGSGGSGEDESDADDDYSPHLPEGNYAGGLQTPVPMNQMGLFVSDMFGRNFAAEMQLLQVVRSPSVYEELKSAGFGIYRELTDSQELMLVQFRINLLAAQNDEPVTFYSSSFKLLRENGQPYEMADGINLDITDDLKTMYAGGTQDGWVCFIVDQADKNLRISLNYGQRSVWFTTDPNVQLAEGLEEYQSIYAPPSLPAINSGAQQGSRTNPVPIGTGIMFETHETYSGEQTFVAEIQVLEAVRGEDAEAMLDADSGKAYLLSELPPGYEFLLLKMQVKVTQSSGNSGVSFDSFSFELISGQGIVMDRALSKYNLPDALGDIYPGDYVTGCIGYMVDASDAFPLIAYQTWGQ